MENKSILTAIIFTYNHKNSISRCIESLIEQKTQFKYEIHIWDDCSTDGTSEICAKYGEKYPDLIRVFIQKENTFTKPDLELQSFAAISNIKTEYFSVIDGDDYWCDSNKLQIALEFLEANKNYVGFAHDTIQVNEYDGSEKSYIHELNKYQIENPVVLDAGAPFFLTSSRIFRYCGYEKLRILPIDYLLYYYHLARGPIHYHDKIMASYVISKNSTFANLPNVKHLNGMFPFRLMMLFNYEKDGFCTDLLKRYDVNNGIGLRRYYFLNICKSVFGIKYGWRIWFYLVFFWRYGKDSLSINYVYDRKKAKERIDNLFVESKKNWLLLVCIAPYRLMKLILRPIFHPGMIAKLFKSPRASLQKILQYFLRV